MNMRPRIILAFCVSVAVGGTQAQAAVKPPPTGTRPAQPPEAAPAPIVAPPGVITGPVRTPVAGAPPPIQAAGPAPTGVTVTGTPFIANLSWNAMPGAQRYAVYRLDGVNLSVEVTPPGFTGTQFQNVVPDPQVTYRYVVDAYYPNGTSAESAAVQFLSPPPINPSGFSAHDQGQGTVAFQWQQVPGIGNYRLDGPGIAPTGFIIQGSSPSAPVMGATVSNVPGGPDTWHLVALYPGNNADYARASTASTMVHSLPPHSKHWLTLSQGPGTPSQVQAPAAQQFNDAPGGQPSGNSSGDLYTEYDPFNVTWLSQTYVNYGGGYGLRPDTNGPHAPCGPGDTTLSPCDRAGLKVWLDTVSLLWDDPGQANNEAVYGNPGDLGVGRRTYCEQKSRAVPVPGVYTVCYATAHGPTAVDPGYNNLQTITHPAPGASNEMILSMVITKDASGTTFMALSKTGKYVLLPSVGLDSEGPKTLPFVCMSCHGGTYNPNTRKVDGASFLPLDPELLAFASPADQAAQEEKFRQINLMIYNSGSSPVVTSYVNGLYNGALGQPGAKATPDFVPSGWAPQAGLYRQIVRPYCAVCHMGVAGTNVDLNFASWTNFQQNAPRIQGAVCGAHTMPHSELQYKAFWLKDTGPLYLPGLLFASLSIPGC